MTDYSKVNAWMAEKCGVDIEIFPFGDDYVTYQGVLLNYEWTIIDPRCREIIANKYSIEIFWASTYNKWAARKRGIKTLQCGASQITVMMCCKPA